MSYTIEGVDSKSGAIPYGSKDSLAIALLRQILSRMEKVNTWYNVYSQPEITPDVNSRVVEQQTLIANDYRSTLQLQVSTVAVVITYSVFLDNGPLTSVVMTPNQGKPLTRQSVDFFVDSELFGARGGYFEFNTPPTNPITRVVEKTEF